MKNIKILGVKKTKNFGVKNVHKKRRHEKCLVVMAVTDHKRSAGGYSCY